MKFVELGVKMRCSYGDECIRCTSHYFCITTLTYVKQRVECHAVFVNVVGADHERLVIIAVTQVDNYHGFSVPDNGIGARESMLQ